MAKARPLRALQGASQGRLQCQTFESTAGPWRMWLWTPAPDLAEAVAALWATDAQTGAFRERVLPRETVELMINFGGRQVIHQIDRPQEPLFFRHSWVSGLQTACLEIESPTPARLIAASLRPAHAGPLLGVSGQDITNRVVPLDAVLAGMADELASRLEATPSVAGRFLQLEDFLRERLRAGRRPNPAACRATDRILSTGGRIAARALTDELGCSARYLEKQLGSQVGLPPKQLSKLVRFSRAIEQVRCAPRVDWGRIAADCGYYDQPHFNRDFRLFTGATPTEFLALRDPSTQAMMVE